jgi:hypothetical protein
MQMLRKIKQTAPRIAFAVGAVLASGAAAVIPSIPSRAIQLDQLRSTEKAISPSVEQVTITRDAQSAVEQIAPDAIVVPPQGEADDATAKNQSVAPSNEIQFGGSKGAVYTAVSNAWVRLRARGQQPTPELISQEVGQETFNMFLNLFPSSETIFAIDSDQFPLSLPN